MIQIKPKSMICVQPLYCIINNKNKYSPSFKNYFLIQQSDSCHLQKSEVLTCLDCFTAVSLVNISVNINQHPCPNCSHLSIATRYKRSAKTNQQKHFMRINGVYRVYNKGHTILLSFINCGTHPIQKIYSKLIYRIHTIFSRKTVAKHLSAYY